MIQAVPTELDNRLLEILWHVRQGGTFATNREALAAIKAAYIHYGQDVEACV
jgi:hypothetical protein